MCAAFLRCQAGPIDSGYSTSSAAAHQTHARDHHRRLIGSSLMPSPDEEPRHGRNGESSADEKELNSRRQLVV